MSLKHILLEKGARIGSSLYDCAMDLVERGKALKRGGDPCTKKSIGYTTSHGIPGGHRDKVPWKTIERLINSAAVSAAVSEEDDTGSAAATVRSLHSLPLTVCCADTAPSFRVWLQETGAEKNAPLRRPEIPAELSARGSSEASAEGAQLTVRSLHSLPLTVCCADTTPSFRVWLQETGAEKNAPLRRPEIPAALSAGGSSEASAEGAQLTVSSLHSLSLTVRCADTAPSFRVWLQETGAEKNAPLRHPEIPAELSTRGSSEASAEEAQLTVRSLHSLPLTVCCADTAPSFRVWLQETDPEKTGYSQASANRMVDSFRGERRELNAEIDRLRGVISRLKPSTADAGVQCDGAQTTDAGAQCDTAQTADAGAQCDVKKGRANPCVVCKRYKLELETAGITIHKGGPFKGSIDLGPIEVYKERAEVLSRDLADKGVELRELNAKMSKLTSQAHADAPQRHAERLASTMICKKAVWERSTCHMVDTYAECPVCEGASGGAFNPFQFELGHFASCTRAGQARASICATAADAGELDDYVAICHECNAWHEAHSRQHADATLADVKQAYQKLQRVYVPESLSPVRPESPVDSLGLDLSVEDEIEDESPTATQKHARDNAAAKVGEQSAAARAVATRKRRKEKGLTYEVINGGGWVKKKK